METSIILSKQTSKHERICSLCNFVQFSMELNGEKLSKHNLSK